MAISGWPRWAALVALTTSLVNESISGAPDRGLGTATAAQDDGQGLVGASNVAGPIVPPGTNSLSAVSEPADCTPSVDGSSRYFVSVQSTTGGDILNTT